LGDTDVDRRMILELFFKRIWGCGLHATGSV